MSSPMSTVDEALAVIMRGLVASAEGEPYDEEELQEAATVCVMAEFLSLGISPAVTLRNFEEREHTFRFSYSEAEGLSVEVEWLDGSTEIHIELGARDR